MSRRVLVFAALAAALGVVALWPQSASGPPRIDFALPALADLSQVVIRRTGAPPVTLTRGPTGWTAGGDALDPFAAEAFTAALTPSVTMDTVRPLAADEASRYGVTEDAITVELGPTTTVRIGKVVDGRRTFVWWSGAPNRVYRATANLRAVFDRPAASWVDRRLVHHEYAAIAQVESRVGDRLDWRAERADPSAPWSLTHPVDAVTDPEGVASVVATLTSAQATRFVDAGGPVERAVTVKTFAGQSATVGLGAPRPDGSRIAAVGGRFAELPNHLATFLAFDQGAVLEQRVFPVTADAIAEVRFGNTPPLVEIDGQWRAGPGGPVLPQAQVDAVLAGLAGLRSAGSPEPPPGAFDPPHLQVTVRTRDNVQHAVVVGAVFNGTARFARVQGRPPFVLGGAAVERLKTDPATLVAE